MNHPTNGMNKTEQELIKELQDAPPKLRLAVACNLAKTGRWAVIGQAGILGDRLVSNRDGAVNIPLPGGIAME